MSYLGVKSVSPGCIGDIYLVARLDIVLDNKLGQRVLKILLDSSLERTRAKLCVISLVSYKITRLVRDCELIAELLNTLVESGQLDVDNLEYRLTAEEGRTSLYRRCG